MDMDFAVVYCDNDTAESGAWSVAQIPSMPMAQWHHPKLH